MEWLDGLRDLSMPAIILRVALAMLMGGILGSERGRKKRPAGFRTYMLVSIGATLVMMTNQYVTEAFGTGDPVRMGAQVVSGIGFLGAGTIILTRRNQVRGITTAAGLWTAACSGLAIGIGFYEGALVGCVAVYITMAFMQRLDDYLHNHSKVMELYMEYDKAFPFSEFLEYARANGFEISDVEISKNKYAKGNAMVAQMLATNKEKGRYSREQALETLGKAPGILHLEAM